MTDQSSIQNGVSDRVKRRHGYRYTMPETLLNSPDMRKALAVRDWRRVFHLVNLRSGASYEVIAAATGVSKGRVGDYRHGRVTPRGCAVISRIADGLGIPGGLLDLDPFPWEASTSDLTEQRQVVQPHIIAPRPTDDALLHVARAGVQSGADPWEVVELLKRLESSDIDNAVLDTISTATDRLCRDYPSASAPELRRRTHGWLRYVASQLRGRLTLSQHKDLLVLAGWLLLLGGCVEYDLGQRQNAEVSRLAALRIGREAGHREIVAWAFEMACWFALTQGRFTDVLNFADAGLGAERRPAETARSVGVQLYAQRAKAYARMGNRRMVEQALGDGYDILGRLPRPTHPEHHFTIDPDKWDFYAMDAYRLSGDDYRASRHAWEVLRLGTGPDGVEHSPMRMAEARLTLGVSAARSGELEEAVSLGGQALTAGRRSLPSLLMVGKELQYELDNRYPREATTRAFHHDLQALAHQPTSSEH